MQTSLCRNTGILRTLFFFTLLDVLCNLRFGSGEFLDKPHER